jgi:hypothetical protein
MGPSPVGVNHDRSADVAAAAGCALGPGQGRLAFGVEGAGLLGAGGCQQSRGGGENAVHCELRLYPLFE